MLLEDATSKEQVEAALEAGDDELLYDIKDQIKETARSIRSLAFFGEYEDFDLFNSVDCNEDFLNSLIRESDPNLSGVPREKVAEDILYWARRCENSTRRSDAGIFKVGDDCRGQYSGFSYSFSTSVNYSISESDLFENCEFVPSDMAEDFYKELGGDIDWNEGTEVIQEQHGYGPGYGYVEVCISEDDFRGFCHDLLRDYHRNWCAKIRQSRSRSSSTA